MPEAYESAPWIKTQRYGIKKMLPNETAVTWYKALLLCANGDGKLTPAERDWVIGHATTYHPQMSKSQVDELRTYDGTSSTDEIEKLIFSDPLAKQGRYVLIYEAIQASAADDEYSEGEKATIRKMAAKLGISETKIRELENLHAEEKALREKSLNIWWGYEGIPGEDS